MIDKCVTTAGVILASGSMHRAQLLKNAGLVFKQIPAEIDERAIEAPLLTSGLEPSDIAQVLAEAKALDISKKNPDKLVIGCDQTLSLQGELLHKPSDMKGARLHLLNLSGKSHQLNAAIALALNGDTIWRHVDIAHMFVRKLSPPFIGRYLAEIGEIALSSVGAYQIEGQGIQLFERIDGDYFTVIGLPLLPLLAKLRKLGVIDG